MPRKPKASADNAGIEVKDTMHEVAFKLPLGHKVIDKYTGVKGIITSMTQKINGAIQYSVQPWSEEGRYKSDAYGIDEVSLEPQDKDTEAPPITVARFKFETGDRVVHRINGFEGIITARSVHVNGCIMYGIEGKLDKDGKQQDQAAWEVELQLLDKGLNASDEKPLERKRTGGPTTKFVLPD